MDNMIVINNLKFCYDDSVIFNDFNLSIKNGSFTTLVGSNGSGKSTLVRLLTGLLKFDGSIFIDGLSLDSYNISLIRDRIGVVFQDVDDVIVGSTVFDDLISAIGNGDYSNVNDIVSYLGIGHLLNKSFCELSFGERQVVLLAKAILKRPKLLIFDDAFSMIDSVTRGKIFELLRLVNRDFGVTILNITSEIDESLYGDFIILMDDGHVVLSGTKDFIYKQEKLLKGMGISLPFMVDLSKRLSYYDLVDGFVFDMNEMIDALWK